MAINQLDITKVGPMSYRQLQSLNNNQNNFDYLIGDDDPFGFNYSPTLFDPIKDSPEQVQSSVGNWGESMWDNNVANEEEFQRLGDIRANNQWSVAKLGAGISKGLVLAGTTFVDGTLGFAYGLTQAINSWSQGDGFLKGASKLWDNEISNALSDINKKMEEWLPNYRTQAEIEGPWYKNLDTMNFWADTFIKNLGFTVGALYSGAAWTKGLRALKILKGGLGHGVVGSLMSAINEGRVEANHNVGDWLELQTMQLEDAKQKALRGLSTDDPLYYANIALIENSFAKQKQDLNDRAAAMGNGILLANTILLSYNNFKTFGKIYSQGAKNAAKNFAGQYKKDLGKRVVLKDGKYAFEDITTKEAIANGLKTGLREGAEEMNQAWISETMGTYKSPDSPDAYYNALLDEDANIRTTNFLESATQGFINTYGNGQRWEEFVVGALTGLLGVPTAGKAFNSGTETYLGKGKWLGLTGGLFGEIQSANAKNAEGNAAVNVMNQYAERIATQKGHFVQDEHFINVMNGYATENNTFEFKNAEDNSDFAAIASYARVGKLNDLLELVDKDFENISDEELVSVARNTTRPGNEIQGWKNSDGSFMSDDEKGRSEMRKELVAKRDKIKKNIEKYEDAVDDVRSLTQNSPTITEDQITELAWLHWKIGRFEERFGQMKTDYKDVINEFRNILNQSLQQYEENKGEEGAVSEEVTNIINNIKLMTSFLNSIQNPNIKSPLGLASFIKDNKDFVDTYFSEDVIDLFNALADDNLEYNKAKSLYKALTDITKIADAAKTFNDRYKEFVEDPLKLQKNREKLEKQSESNRKNKVAQNLAEKIINSDKVKDVVDTEGVSEAIELLQNIEERTPEQQAALDKMLQDQELDVFKEEIFEIVNQLDGTDSQIVADVQNLLDQIEKKEDISEGSEIFIDLNKIYKEEEHVGKSDAHRQSDLEDRMAKAEMALREAERQLNDKKSTLDTMGNGSLNNKTNLTNSTGQDETTKVEPIATAGETISKTDEVLNSEAELFLNYIDVAHHDRGFLKTFIIDLLSTLPADIESNYTKIHSILSGTEAYRLLSISLGVVQLNNAIYQYIADKMSPENDRNPINPKKEISELKEEQPQNTETLETYGPIKMYWRPSISRLPYAFNKQNPLGYFHENEELLEKNYNQPQITFIKAVGEYLKNKGAFDRIDKGLVNPDTKIYFATDPELNKEAGAFVILLVDENNNVLGNLPTAKSTNLFDEEIDKTTGSYFGLLQFSEAFENAFNSDDAKTDGLWVMPKVFSVIDNWMIGKVIYSSDYNNISTIFSSEDSSGNKTELSYQFAIGAIDRGGNVRIVRDSDRRQDTVEDREINKPIEVINGQPYVLLSTGNNGSSRKYTAVPVAMKKLNGDLSLPINKHILLALEYVFSLQQSSTPQQIVKAKESLQELVGAKFTIIVKQNSVELKVLNTENKWETVYIQTPESTFEETATTAFNNMVDKYRYQMALKYINKKFGSENYNDIIKGVVETNLYPGLNHTLSNWFTIRPLKEESGQFKMIERKQAAPPKTTRNNPTRRQTAASDNLASFEYKGRQMKIDTSDWNTLYWEENGVQKKASVRDTKGNLNVNSAKAAAYAFGILQHQDMSKPYSTQWGEFDSQKLEFVEKKEDTQNTIETAFDNLGNIDDMLNGLEKGTSQNLDTKAEELGFFKSLLHKKAWEALTDTQKQDCINNPQIYDALAIKFNFKKKSFSVDVDYYIFNATLFRKAKDTIYEKWDSKQEVEWLGKVLPQFSSEERLQIVNSLIRVSNSNNPEFAWGQFKNGVITIYEGAAKGTLYHEAFHAVTHTLLNEKEVDILFKEAAKKYGDLTHLDLEENLAEDFRQYVQYEQDPEVSSIRRMFRKLKHFVQGLYGKDRHINRIFYKINRGNYASRKPSNTDVVVNYTNIQYENELKEILAKAPRNEQGQLFAPNGKVSNLTERQYAQVRTGAFIDWFGDWINDPKNASKVVDENGEPMVVYHTGDNWHDITTFKTTQELTISKDEEWVTNKDLNNYRQEGYEITSAQEEEYLNGESIVISRPNAPYFASNIKVSKTYGAHRVFEEDGRFVGTLYPVFLNIKDGVVISGNNAVWNNIQHDGKHVTTRDLETIYRNKTEGLIIKNIYDVGSDILDGEAVTFDKEWLSDVFIVYNSNQIKSATDNIGTFSRENNNIYYRKLEIQLELQALKEELRDASKYTGKDKETLPQVKELYAKWREIMQKPKGFRQGHWEDEAQEWIDSNGFNEVAEPTTMKSKTLDKPLEGFVKAVKKSTVDKIASWYYADFNQYMLELEVRISDLQNRLDFMQDREQQISDDAIAFQEEREYLEIQTHYLQKTSFNRLTQEEQEFIISRGISKQEYDDLTLEEREHLLFCR